MQTTRTLEAEARRVRLIADYPALWRRITQEWQQPGPDDRAWLTYSANYLLRTGGVRWAIDPLRLSWRVSAAAPVAACDLAGAAFVLLTHRHADHLDLDLLAALAAFPIYWVTPPALLETVQRAGLRRERILTPVCGQPLLLNGVRITPFDGLHWEAGPDGDRRGVPATGYLAEFGGRRWLFPGDTRCYDPAGLPDFGALDGVFAHVWLGRGAALDEPPPLLDDFCRFCLALKPRRIVLAHLYEFGRDASDFWDATHAARVHAHLEALGFHGVETVCTGGSVVF